MDVRAVHGPECWGFHLGRGLWGLSALPVGDIRAVGAAGDRHGLVLNQCF